MTNEELDDLAKRSDAVAAIAADLHRAHTAIRALVAFCIAFLLLVAVVGTVAYQTVRNKQSIDTAHDIFVANCEAGNEFRVGERELWNFILNSQPSSTRTPAQQKQFDEFRAIVDRIFALRDCTLPPEPSPTSSG